MSTRLIPFSFGGVEIRKDEQGRVSLTDLWRSAGSAKKQRPVDWLALPTTAGFVAAAEKFLKVGKSDLLKVQKGRQGSTFAHQQLALEYAQYLSADLAVAVNQVFFERLAEQKNPELAVRRAVRSWSAQGKDDNWISKRLESISTRKHFTTLLAKHGVTGLGFRLCTNASYIGLFGKPAADLRTDLSLREDANLRDHLPTTELIGVQLAEALAGERIQEQGLWGNEDCAQETNRAARLVATAITSTRRLR